MFLGSSCFAGQQTSALAPYVAQTSAPATCFAKFARRACFVEHGRLLTLHLLHRISLLLHFVCPQEVVVAATDSLGAPEAAGGGMGLGALFSRQPSGGVGGNRAEVYALKVRGEYFACALKRGMLEAPLARLLPPLRAGWLQHPALSVCYFGAV